MDAHLPLLYSSVLFRNFSREEVDHVLNCLKGEVRTYGRRELIFSQGQKMDAVGVVLEGQVLHVMDNENGARTIVSEHGVGDVIGEIALQGELLQGYYEAGLGTSCSVLMLKIEKIIRADKTTCRMRGRVIENIMGLILANNRRLSQKLDLVSYKSLRERTLHFLSTYAKRMNSRSFEIPFSRTDMADYLLVDRSALSRELQRMKSDGLIDFQGNTFTVHVMGPAYIL